MTSSRQPGATDADRRDPAPTPAGESLDALLERLNATRRSSPGPGGASTRSEAHRSPDDSPVLHSGRPFPEDRSGAGEEVDPRAASLLETARRKLAVYGSLAPGEPNHDQLAELVGEWRDGWVTGDLLRGGWGSALGYPGLIWRPRGPRVPARLFVSDDLPAHWDRLDRFEGDGYTRILVSFHRADGRVEVANLYELVRER